MYYIKILTVLVAMFVALSSPSYAKDLTPLEKEEHIQNLNQINNTIDEARVLLEKIAQETESQCMKAVGATDFCKCLSMKLPTSVDFVGYVSIVGSAKEKLNYDQLSASDKKLVDIVRTTRDACVK